MTRTRPHQVDHAGLLNYQRQRSKPAVVIPPQLRGRVCDALRQSLTDAGHRVLAISVSKSHTHVRVELPLVYAETRRIVGEAKRDSSRAIRQGLPGKVWGAGGSYKIIKDRSHQLRVFYYITTKQAAGAFVWSAFAASRVAAQRRPG